jgi:hypothetical protein
MRKWRKHFIFWLAKTFQILLIAVALVLPSVALAITEATIEK